MGVIAGWVWFLASCNLIIIIIGVHKNSKYTSLSFCSSCCCHYRNLCKSADIHRCDFIEHRNFCWRRRLKKLPTWIFIVKSYLGNYCHIIVFARVEITPLIRIRHLCSHMYTRTDVIVCWNVRIIWMCIFGFNIN